jgi:hypothetical protein
MLGYGHLAPRSSIDGCQDYSAHRPTLRGDDRSTRSCDGTLRSIPAFQRHRSGDDAYADAATASLSLERTDSGARAPGQPLVPSMGPAGGTGQV